MPILIISVKFKFLKCNPLYSLFPIFSLLILLLLTGCGSIAEQGKNPITTAFEVQETTIAKVHAAMKAGNINCQQLVDIYIQRIEQYDQLSKLNAILFVNPNARNRAMELDASFKRTGTMNSLHCVPVILKDNFDTGDMPTAAGSMVLKDSVPPDDAFMVKKLREVGAIILAKSNMAEWAFSPYYTISSTKGETRNAYDLSRVPAGSSGGTASAVAANFGLVGMGSDTGNSIRGPASHLSLVGIRSTIGATSRDGVVPLLLNRDIAGPMTRTVEDAARVFAVIDGYDADDSVTIASKGKLPDSYLPNLKNDGLQGARIGVLRNIFQEGNIDPDIGLLMDNAIADLKRLGAEIIDPVEIFDFEHLTKATGFCSRFRYDINNYFASLGDAAPVKKLKDIVDGKNFHKLSEGAMKWAMSKDVPPEQHDTPCVDVEGDPRRKALLDAVVSAMDETKVDVLIYPSWNYPARKLDDLKSPHGNNSPIIAPHSGQPAITVPMGFTQSQLPAGLQMLGRPFSEPLLFQFAYAYEQGTKHRKPPVNFP